MLSKRILVLMFLVLFLFLAGCNPAAPPIDENQAPVITSTPVDTATVGEIYYYNVGATDPDGDTLTFLLTTKPVGMIINLVGLISWVPAAGGDYNVTVTVSDGVLSDTQSFTIVVEKPCVPPCPPDPCVPPCPLPVTLIGIDATPDIISLPQDGTEQLIVKALYIDGSSIDITLDCVYFVPLFNCAVTVDDTGLVSSRDCSGEDTITVFYTPKGNTWSDTVEVTVEPELGLTQNSGQNDTNKAADHPYINWTIDGMCVEFEFVNPTVWNFAFTYRIDGEEGVISSWSDTTISGGELDGQKIGPSYNIVNMPAGEPGLMKTVTVCAEEEIWVGLRLGAENDYFLDWIKFKNQICWMQI